MNAINWKKLLLPNIPYLLFVYLFDKVGQAVRLAPGADLSGKVLSLGEGFSMAFSNPLPSLAPMDLLIGILGAVLIRLIVYVKGKNAKKYRKGIEYGSARWGTAEDIKPYTDPVFQNNVLLTQTERLTMNSRPKQPKYARNKNILVIGGSGSGKTRFFVKPNLMQMHSSYVVTDPKGTVLVECGKLLQRGGYRIKVLNTINFKKSMKYNPFAYLRSEKDILKLVNTLIANTKGDGEKAGEDFWVKSERLFYCALIGYIWYEAPEEEKNFTTLLEMINASEAREDDPEFQSPVDLMFERLEEKDPEHFAVRQYKKFLLSAGKTRSSILISCGARLAPFDIKELRDLMETDEMELDTIGDRKTALFVIISDTDDTFNFVVSILYTQLFNLLCDKADDEYGGRLPVHVRCLLDEFANIGQIPKFEKLIATIRSREISASIILQSQSQLKAIYKDNADTIVGNCDTTLFLGGKEKTTLKEMSEILGKETIDSFNTSENRGREVSHGLNYQKLGKQLMTEDEIAVMDGGKCILQLRGVRPFFSDKYDITKHPNYKYLSDYDKKNTFDMEKHLRRRPALVKSDEPFDYYEISEAQLAKGNNGLVKHKYITFSIEADNPAAARARLSRIETDVLNNFKVLGVSAHPLSGYERLKVLHGVFHPAGEPFSFSYDWLTPTGLTTKDFIAPSSFKFGEGRYFAMGKKTGAVSFLEILAPELNDRILADMLDLETGVIVNLHIRSIDQAEAIKTIKRKITDLDKMKIEEQKKAVRSGYDMDIIPSDLATFGNEAKNLLQDLQSRNERMFLLTFLVVNMADTKRKLENDIFAAAGIAQKYNCALTRLDYQQEAGLMSSIPLGENLIPIQRGLTTSSTAIFIPFITQELFQTGAALYYGLNALSNNMILCDRKQLKNPNGLILGTPGSGKSFAAKREITNAFLITDDDIFICDPEAEYFALVKRLGGQVIRLSPTGKGMDGTPQYVNPMDMNLNYSEDDSPLALKSDFILSLCELVIGGKEGLQPVDKTVIDRAVRNVYRDYLADPVPEKMPILGDLYNELLKQPEPEAARIAAALELYVSGSLNVFNHRTNVELSNRLVCFDIKQLGKQLKKLGMLIVQDQIWNRVTINRAEKKSTRYYMDEFHLLLKEEQTAAYSVEIWKRFRKWGGIPTAITQNIKDLLASREVENIFENSDFVLMLNQAQGDRAILAKQLNISPQQMKYVTHTEAGEGLIFYGNVVLPFVDHFPKDTELYRIMTTKPEEVSSL